MFIYTIFSPLKMLPNFLIVGAAKAGTTALYHFLKQHPDVFLPANKEPHFFSHFKLSEIEFRKYTKPYLVIHIVRSWDEYKAQYNGAKKKAVGDMSTSYLFLYERSVNYIKQFLDRPKIIVILRNPLESCFSHYNMMASGMNEPMSFEESFEDEPKRLKKHFFQMCHFSRFLYYKQIKAYKQKFTTKVFIYDDYKNQPQKFFDEICDFLKISHFTPEMSSIHVTQYPKGSFWLISKFDKVVLLIPRPIRQFIKSDSNKIIHIRSQS